jgi:ectoine hydroxylase-related dioxygenase (phytanoyl-CoA dioxygenase family)
MDFTPLTPQQRADFERDGFLIVRDVLDRPMIDRLIAAGDRLINSSRQESRQKTPDGLYDGFRNCVTMDDAFIPLMTHPKVTPLVVQIMGPNLHLFTSHLIYKHPDPAGTPITKRAPGWHRDILGVDADLGAGNVPRLDIKCAYYLTDLSSPNSGATMMAPGTHKLTAPLIISEGRVDPIDALEPSLQAGDCVLFENRTWHAAGANLSGRTRKAVMIGYTYLWMRAADFLVQPPEFIEKLDPIGQQFIDGLKDPDGHFIPGGLSTPLREWCKVHRVMSTA